MATMITADQVKKLRDQTGAGMMECKAALTEANGDFEEANTILRKRGLASAAKKAGRTTSEGLIGTGCRRITRRGILVEVNCESDFVARTPDFQQLMQDVLAEIEKAGDAANDAWLKDPHGPVQKRVAAGIAKLGENMAVSRVRALRRPGLRRAVHPPGRQARRAGRVRRRDAGDRRRARNSQTLVKEIAMQIAAASPAYATRDAVPADILDKEKAIYRAQMENSGKPANVHRQDRRGQARELLRQVVLPDQPSIRDPKMTVTDVLAAANKTLGGRSR